MNKENEIRYAAAKIVFKCQEIAAKNDMSEEQAYDLIREQIELSDNYIDYLIEHKSK